MKTTTWLGMLVCVWGFCLMSWNTAFAQDADLVMRNGVIWTVDESNPQVQAIASLNGKLIYVGSNNGVKKHIGKRTKVVDLKGQFAVPGFNDNHVHFEGTGRLLYGLNLLDVSDEGNFVSRIKEVDERYAPGTWIVGGDWSAYETWAAGDVAKAGRMVDPNDPYGNLFTPSRAMLDGFTQDRPVLVRRFDRKVYMANGKALEIAGIKKGMPDPEGIIVDRDESGEPTGILKNPVKGAVESTVLVRDNVGRLFYPLIPSPTREQKIKETLRGWEQMRLHGITSYQDMPSPQQVDIYKELREKGMMTVRVHVRPTLERWEDMAHLGIKVGFGDEWIRWGAVKAWVDGIMGNSSARFYEPYTHDANRRGIWRDIMFPWDRNPDDPEQLRSRLERLALDADAAGIQLTVHAIGDEANGYILDVIEKLNEKNGKKDRRFRLVHAQVIKEKDIKRFGELGVIAEVQPYHCTDDMRWMEERIGHERSRGAYAFKSLWDAGTVVCFGTDSPGTNASRYYLNPMLGLYAAVTRQTLTEEPKGGWFPDEKITIQQAIQAYTLNSAYATFEENIKGTITVGKLADITVLSANLLNIDPNKIKDVEAIYTVVGGKIVHEKKKM